jgi:NTP pyrophosphatase (non-canonical NTP hydrolase)
MSAVVKNSRTAAARPVAAKPVVARNVKVKPTGAGPAGAKLAPLTLRQMQLKVDEAVAGFGGYWGPFEMLARLTEELGEIASDLQRNHGLRPRKTVTDIEEEVGDLLFTLGAFANIHKLDLEAAFARVLEKYAERDLRAWKAKQAQQKGR